MNPASTPRLSVVVPARDGAGVLAESLPALAASDLPRSRWELIVVDDASADHTALVARSYADRVISLEGGAHGPAYARNRGGEAARGAVLAFVDADVRVHPDTLRKLLECLTERPDVSAVFGAYDTDPTAPGLVSQYRNLLHHFVHAAHAGETDTFWAGCGAIRRRAFIEAGGFDAGRYRAPQIEDIALGYRLRSLGHRILLRPDIQGTHLKRWTLRGMVLADVRDRGIPWMRLLLGRESVGSGTLNVRGEERLLTALGGLGLAALLAAPMAGSWWLIALAGMCALLIVARNAALLRWFARERGVLFAIAIVPLRLLYYVLNAAAAGWVLLQHAATGRARPEKARPGAAGAEPGGRGHAG